MSARRRKTPPVPGPIRIARSLGHVLTANLGVPRHYLGNGLDSLDDHARTGDTVLLIHGFWQTRNTMAVMEQRLRADGYQVLSFHLGGFLGNFNSRGIPHLARRIEDKLERLHERGEFGRLHIIGHSKGGLVGRYLVARRGWHDRVRTLVTLGSPHHGTPTAWIGLVGFTGLVSRSVWQMLPNSSLIGDLQDSPVPATTRFVSIYSKADLVCPWRYSQLSEAEGVDIHNRVVAGLGHMELVDDPWVYGLVARQLRMDRDEPTLAATRR
jgi:triacylglycerol lipase